MLEFLRNLRERLMMRIEKAYFSCFDAGTVFVRRRSGQRRRGNAGPGDQGKSPGIFYDQV